MYFFSKNVVTKFDCIYLFIFLFFFIWRETAQNKNTKNTCISIFLLARENRRHESYSVHYRKKASGWKDKGLYSEQESGIHVVANSAFFPPTQPQQSSVSVPTRAVKIPFIPHTKQSPCRTQHMKVQRHAVEKWRQWNTNLFLAPGPLQQKYCGGGGGVHWLDTLLGITINC